MTRYFQETYHTIRDNPVRAAAAALLLLSATIYVCWQPSEVSVAEMGEEYSDVFDLGDPPETSIDLVSTEDSEEPATVKRVAGRDQYHDSQVVAAISEITTDSDSPRQTWITPVSGQSNTSSSSEKPVWLLGVLLED